MVQGFAFDPFRGVDRLVERMFAAAGSPAATAMDLYRSGDHYVLHLDLPGIDPGTLYASVDGSTLTITAQRSLRTDEDVEWLLRERPTGTFTRRLALGDDVDTSNIAATYQDGVLTLTLPVTKATKPRKIAIAGKGSPALHGPAAEAKVISHPATS
ncbi:Hsp20/alpha crystallin family protein [Catellatospora citrea]|uniref:Hsp20/alpha crystallin family protein n=1 Tax=Catellatospora citrea TaxID=53366 RepID=UPI0033DEE928